MIANDMRDKLGRVPPQPGYGWTTLRLKHIATCNDDVLGENTPTDREILYVDIGSVNLGSGIQRTEPMSFGAAPSRARRLVQDGDVIVSTVRTYLKAIAPIVNPPKHLVVSTGFAVVRPGPRLDRGFAGYALQADEFVDQVISRSVGVSYPAINASDLMAISLPLPTIGFQRQIAAFLDHETAKINDLIAKQERLISLLGEKRQAVIIHAVTKGVRSNTPMKDSGTEWLGKVPDHWAVCSIGQASSIQTGSTPDRSVPEYWGGDIPWVKTGEVNYDAIYSTEECITSLGLKNSAAKLSPRGTLLMAMYGQGATRGRVAILGVEAAYNQACAAISPTKALSSEYLRYFLWAAYAYVRDDGNETSQMNLRASYISKIKVTRPPTQEQAEIVSYLDDEVGRIDAIISKARLAIGMMRERRSALVSAAVTGKIDVREAVQA